MWKEQREDFSSNRPLADDRRRQPQFGNRCWGQPQFGSDPIQQPYPFEPSKGSTADPHSSTSLLGDPDDDARVLAELSDIDLLTRALGDTKGLLASRPPTRDRLYNETTKRILMHFHTCVRHYDLDWTQNPSDSVFSTPQHLLTLRRERDLRKLIFQFYQQLANTDKRLLHSLGHVKTLADFATLYRPAYRLQGRQILENFITPSELPNIQSWSRGIKQVFADVPSDLTRIRQTDLQDLEDFPHELCNFICKLLDISATVESVNYMFPYFALEELWHAEINELGLLETLTSAYVALLPLPTQLSVLLKNGDRVAFLEFMIRRTRAFLAKCIVVGVWQVTLHQRADDDSTNAEASSSPSADEFDKFIEWSLELSNNTAEYSDDFNKDLRRVGMRKVLRKLKTRTNVDAERILFVENALIGNEAPDPSRNLLLENEENPPSFVIDNVLLEALLTPTDKANIKHITSVLPDYGEGFIYLALRRLGWSPNYVVEVLLEEKLPDDLANLDPSMTLIEALESIRSQLPRIEAPERESGAGHGSKAHELEPLTEQEKKSIIEFGREPVEVYDDDFKEDSDSSRTDNSSQGNSGCEVLSDTDGGESCKQKSVTVGPAGRSENEGGIKEKSFRPVVQGQTLAARRKGQNKGGVANHNRRIRHLAKLRRGML